MPARRQDRIAYRVVGPRESETEISRKNTVRFTLRDGTELDVQLTNDGRALRIAELSGGGLFVEPVASNVIFIKAIELRAIGGGIVAGSKL